MLVERLGIRYIQRMAKHGETIRSTISVRSPTDRKSGSRRLAKIKFGDVTVTGPKPDRQTVLANVQRSTEALKRVAATLAKPGVVLRAKKDVPLYSAAEGEPGVYLRKLNGRVDRGRVIEGVFQVID